MSAGEFNDVTYETNQGLKTTVKVQPETLALTLNSVANASASGDKTAGMPSARVGGSRRQIGINTRTVTIAFSGAAPTGYKAGGKVRLPVPDPTVWDGYDKGQTGTYLGVAVKFAGKSDEKVN